MSESGSFLPHEVEGIITPNHKNARVIRNFIELMVNDDQSLSLEAADKSELERLNMRFIGWPHCFDYVPALFEQIKEYNPHVLILESVGDDANFVPTRELIRNLLMFGVPTQVGLEGNYAEAFIRDVPEHEDDQIMKLIRDNELFPILRKMDISSQQMAEMGFNGDYPSTHVSYMLDWDFGPLELTKRALGPALMADGQINRTREAVMITDVSRISANALAKMDGDVRVMACFGTTHTPVARYFQKRIPGSDLRFIDRKTHQVTKNVSFSRQNTVVREANIKNRISENNLGIYVLEIFLDMQASLLQHFDGDKRPRAEQLVQKSKAVEDLIKVRGPELLQQWDRIDSKRLTTEEKREKSREDFLDAVRQLVAEALSAE